MSVACRMFAAGCTGKRIKRGMVWEGAGFEEGLCFLPEFLKCGWL